MNWEPPISWLRLRNKLAAWLLERVLGLGICDDCGGVFAHGGMPAATDLSESKTVYLCERCSNAGFVYQQVEDAVKEFGPFGQLN